MVDRQYKSYISLLSDRRLLFSLSHCLVAMVNHQLRNYNNNGSKRMFLRLKILVKMPLQ